MNAITVVYCVVIQIFVNISPDFVTILCFIISHIIHHYTIGLREELVLIDNCRFQVDVRGSDG